MAIYTHKQAQVKNTIEEKFNSRFSFLPQSTDYYVSGGIFARLYNDLPIKDVDLFIVEKKNYEKFVRNHFELNDDYVALNNQGEIIPKNTIDSLERAFEEALRVDEELALRASTGLSRAIQVLRADPEPLTPKRLVTKWLHKPTETKVDVVNIWADKITPEAFCGAFDFTLVRMYAQRLLSNTPFTLDVLETDNLDHIADKQLIFTGCLLFGTKSNNTLTRMLKYTRLGFKLQEHTFQEIAEKIQEALVAGLAKKLKPDDIGRLGYDQEEEEKLEVGF